MNNQQPPEKHDVSVRVRKIASQPMPVSGLHKDCVGVASEDSFPASDPLSWTGVVATGMHEVGSAKKIIAEALAGMA